MFIVWQELHLSFKGQCDIISLLTSLPNNKNRHLDQENLLMTGMLSKPL